MVRLGSRNWLEISAPAQHHGAQAQWVDLVSFGPAGGGLGNCCFPIAPGPVPWVAPVGCRAQTGLPGSLAPVVLCFS